MNGRTHVFHMRGNRGHDYLLTLDDDPRSWARLLWAVGRWADDPDLPEFDDEIAVHAIAHLFAIREAAPD